MSLTAIKLGGSLITDKTVQSSFRADVTRRIAAEVQRARVDNPDLELLLGHGSGSFGHFEAKKYDTLNGVSTAQGWYGFARVAHVAAQLNKLVAEQMLDAGIPVFPIQPSASIMASDGKIHTMHLDNIQTCLQNGLVPLVYGDVAFDTIRGGTIVSTETVFDFLVASLRATRILLIGEVDGVYDGTGHVIPEITTGNFEEISVHLGSSRGVDVTGGMYAKVKDMLQIANTPPYPIIEIINGLVPDRLYMALINQPVPLTRICST